MKIVSWNVNGIRAVSKKGFSQWLVDEAADVICLQETKANPQQLSPEITDIGEYTSFFASAKRPGYSGTAIYSKIKPDNVYVMGQDEFDDEGRVLCCDFVNLTVISAYFPNSQDGGARLPYKLAFCDAIFQFCDDLVAKGQNVVLCGDYNIAHTKIDLARPESNEHNPGYLPEEREWMSKFLNGGYCDAFRLFCGEGGHYSWWSYRFHAREKNIGWRIDYTCVNNDFVPNVKSAEILSNIQGSDHCPVKIEIL